MECTAALAAVTFRHKAVRDLWWVISSPHLLRDDAGLPCATDAWCGELASGAASWLAELDGEPAPTVEAVYLLSRVHDMARPYHSPLRTGFPPANRAGGEMRKLHLRKLLTRARDAGAPFQTTATDFHFLVHAAALLSEEALLALCKAVSAGRGGSSAALHRAETLLCEYAGMEPPTAPKKGK